MRAHHGCNEGLAADKVTKPQDGEARLPPLAQPPATPDGRALLKGADEDAFASPELSSALRKVSWRVMPLFMAIAVMNHLDRSNLAYAALSFNRDNGLDNQIYALGQSLFFVSFCVFQVPSNLVMVRVGFRAWLAFLLVGWGCVAVSFMFISSAWSFYLCRVLLGVFESGAFPAMWYALTVFFPRQKITKPFAYLTIGIMLANMLGSPLAAGLLALNGRGGLKGWQWLFMMEGIPSILLGALVFCVLPGSIDAARFLTPAERDALTTEVARDHAPGPLAKDLRGAALLLRAVINNGYMWVVFTCAMLASVASHTYLAYTPIIINSLLNGTALSNSASVAAAKGNDSLLPVALAVVPYTLASISSYFVAHSAQRRDEHFWHVSSCLLLAGVILALFPPLAKAAAWAGFLSLSLSLGVGAAANGPAIALVGRLCKGPEQVVAMPLYSSFSVLGGVIGPLLTGRLMSTFGGFTWITVIMGVLMFATGVLIVILRTWVVHDGGLPDGGKRRDCTLACGSRGSSEGAARAAPDSDEVRVVLSKDGGRGDAPTTPKASMV